jgi:hypothetical protein
MATWTVQGFKGALVAPTGNDVATAVRRGLGWSNLQYFEKFSPSPQSGKTMNFATLPCSLQTITRAQAPA